MVVCKYFLQGYCKFGSRCKYDHVNQYGDYDSNRSQDYFSGGRPQGASILKAANTSYCRPEFAAQSFQQSPAQSPLNLSQKNVGPRHNLQEIMQVVSRDLMQSEKGGQWQLSCYGPLKDIANFPGFEDHAPEEVRWECYKALKDGNLPLCQVIVQRLFANVAKINNDLKKKETLYAIIDRWLRENENKYSQSNFSVPFEVSNAISVTSQYFSSPGSQVAPSSSFSFSLSPQQPMNVQSYASNSSFILNQQPAFTPQNPPSFSMGAPTSIDNLAYSNTEDLSQTELEAFKSEKFSFGSIPTKPPPFSLCNI